MEWIREIRISITMRLYNGKKESRITYSEKKRNWSFENNDNHNKTCVQLSINFIFYYLHFNDPFFYITSGNVFFSFSLSTLNSISCHHAMNENYTHTHTQYSNIMNGKWKKNRWIKMDLLVETFWVFHWFWWWWWWWLGFLFLFHLDHL